MFLEDFKGDLTVVFGWLISVDVLMCLDGVGRMTRTTTLSATTTWVAMCRWIMVDRWMAGRNPRKGKGHAGPKRWRAEATPFHRGRPWGRIDFQTFQVGCQGLAYLGLQFQWIISGIKWICFTVLNLWRWLTYHYLHYRSYSHCFHPNCTFSSGSWWPRFLGLAGANGWRELVAGGHLRSLCAPGAGFRSSVSVLWVPLKFGSVNFCTITEQWGLHTMWCSIYLWKFYDSAFFGGNEGSWMVLPAVLIWAGKQNPQPYLAAPRDGKLRFPPQLVHLNLGSAGVFRPSSPKMGLKG